ncbi:MAG TPA: 23S rRNA (pseudouridine(1915)-N(3))-methyltransferase RlmH [Gammaproteobacteria bacterium]|nr:23S rRNA (pseudouridine(1915)-N(3))-methyltransferase RlmH [Gammaproteobacteria bacterium]
MIIRILAIGNKMPSWIETGFRDYAKRFTSGCSLELVEIPAEKRTKNSDISRTIERESEKLLTAVKSNHDLIALDVKGEMWSTHQLTEELKKWQREGRHVDLLIGGPDGLSETCLRKAHGKWSLSPLTLPHPLVRIILAEQLYRAWSVLQNHPYHRG